jgi:hypothetical protein
MFRLVRAGGVFCPAVLLLVGCGSRQPVELSKEEKAIVQIGLAYRDASAVLKRGPKSLAELKPYLNKYGDPEQLLVSPSDDQPYQIVWGVIPSRPAKSSQTNPLLVYEKTGKHGKRYVLDFMLKVHHLSDKEFAEKQGSD